MDISTKGSVTWSSPSNIALVKYWGKLPNQLPQNPSISLTLSDARTITQCSWNKKSDNGISFTFDFEGKKNEKFNDRIEKYLNSIVSIFPFLVGYHLDFKSQNSFPHGAGIASSASAMSSIALCLCSIEKSLGISTSDFYKKASYVARLGSGSAARSIYGGVVSWGDQSSEYASAIDEIGPEMDTIQDTILIVDSNEKAVSSSEGHQLMNQHLHARLRFEKANKNFQLVKKYLRAGDFRSLGEIVEVEALDIHAMMMSSNPPYILIKPNTLAIIQAIKEFRRKQNIDVYFTLDAGPNIHLLYLERDGQAVRSWIKKELLDYCESCIEDRVGSGPTKVE